MAGLRWGKSRVAELSAIEEQEDIVSGVIMTNLHLRTELVNGIMDKEDKLSLKDIAMVNKLLEANSRDLLNKERLVVDRTVADNDHELAISIVKELASMDSQMAELKRGGSGGTTPTIDRTKLPNYTPAPKEDSKVNENLTYDGFMTEYAASQEE